MASLIALALLLALVTAAVAPVSGAPPKRELLWPGEGTDGDDGLPWLGSPPVRLDSGGSAAAVHACGGDYVDVSSRARVVELWNRAGSNSAPDMGWSGAYTGCQQGDIAESYRAVLQTRANFCRSMAGICPIRLVAARKAEAQFEAYYQSLNRIKTHTPATDLACGPGSPFSASTIEECGKSCLCRGATGLRAIDGCIEDASIGNEPVGHRRCLLCPASREGGLGAVPGQGTYPYSGADDCWPFTVLYTLGTEYGVKEMRDGFVAWPPPGFVP